MSTSPHAPAFSFSYRIGHVALLLLLAASFTGCSYIDCKTRRDNFTSETRKSNDLGVIYFKDDKNSEPYYSVSLKKIRRGYAFHAPLYEDAANGISTRFTIQRDKEYKTFSGLQFSYGF